MGKAEQNAERVSCLVKLDLLLGYDGRCFLQNVCRLKHVAFARASSSTVLTAEQNLFQAESNWAVARANVSLGATAIYRALGGGWQIRSPLGARIPLW